MARTVAVVLAVVLCAPAAWAGDREEAEQYFRRGNVLFAEGKLDEATRMFHVCVALSPDLSGPYRRLGQALRRLGRCPEAVDNFLKYLELKPDSRFSGEIREEMRQCARATQLVVDPVKPKATGELRVVVNVPGARVFVGDRDLGASPVSAVRLPEGTYTVLVAEPRHEPWSGEAVVPPGASATVSATLTPLPVPERTDPGRLVLNIVPAGALVVVDGNDLGEAPIPGLNLPPGEHLVEVSMDGHEPVSRVVDVPSGGARSIAIALVRLPTAAPPPPPPSAGPRGPGAGRTVGWVLVAAGATAAVVGAGVGIAASGKAAEYADAGAGADRRLLKSDGESLALTADLTLAAAAALGIVGVVLVAANPPPAVSMDDMLGLARIAPWFDGAAAGIGVSGSY